MASHLNVGLSSLSLNGELQISSQRVRIGSGEESYEWIVRELEKLKVRVDKLLTFKNRYEFPTIGEEGIIYVATDEDIIYIWQDSFIPLTGIEALKVDWISGGGAADGE